MQQHGLRPNAAAQSAGARHALGDLAAGRLLGATAERALSPGHAAVHLLALLPGMSGPSDIPVPQPLREGEGRLRGAHEDVRLPVARDVRLLTISDGQRYVHPAATDVGFVLR